MISYEWMKQEVKKYPKLIKQKAKEGCWEECIQLEAEMWTYRFILEANDND